ncbi:phospholipid/glycerol acyltransferase [Pirellula staleyi DSM 6068]|uniref:Phospholipid/glycerol acyltransferase n=1 Tax=Pirellula staleyi (strain ATCC 27377 / DSM 6068 / ICPB 4128) TaxID=530564 RepID=D2R3Z1_PIRSD|nr:1-acyl-sn-glycerol-3-phosphate acyltransferase [Pirellula staleyi]ADB18840.1 phospholipid/glycerol acyltransferase [Pirellula staleyi DSM 6068]
MQNIIVEKPYRFVPPYRGTFWSTVLRWIKVHEYYLRKTEGVESYEIRHLDRLEKSIADGHGILLTPNHPRTADPLAMGWLATDAKCHFYAMASWHLFNQDKLSAWAINRMGGFSINREGVDRQAINTAIDLIVEAKRAMVIFPEGATSRTSDRLQAMLEGVAFIARSAAKKRAKLSPDKKVVVHPIAIKYYYRGDLEKLADEMLTDIEHRLSWRPQRDLPLLSRIGKVAGALLSLKEIEYLGEARSGKLEPRLNFLINHLLGPIELKWLGSEQSGPVVPRVRALRVKILPDLTESRCDEAERTRRWKDLSDIYLAQQLACYPPDYLASYPSRDRILEILEKFEEDLTDKVRVHGGLHCVIWVGEAIEVSPERTRGLEYDPLMQQIVDRLTEMVAVLAKESALVPGYEPAASST